MTEEAQFEIENFLWYLETVGDKHCNELHFF